MPQWNGFASHIIRVSGEQRSTVNDETTLAEEYGEKILGTEVSRRISCWVGCQTGQEFAVQWECPQYETSVLVELHIDGELVDKELLDKSYTKGSPPGWRVSFEGFRQGDESIRPFIFSDVHFDADAPFRVNSDQIGTISLRFYHILLRLEDKRNNGDSSDINDTHVRHSDADPVGEHKSRLITHRVSAKKKGKQIKRPRKIKRDIIWTFTFLPENSGDSSSDDTKPQPFLVFDFKYRSEAFLRAKGLINLPDPEAMGEQSDFDVERRNTNESTLRNGSSSHGRTEHEDLNHTSSPEEPQGNVARVTPLYPEVLRRSSSRDVSSENGRYEEWRRNLYQLDNEDFYGSEIVNSNTSENLVTINESQMSQSTSQAVRNSPPRARLTRRKSNAAKCPQSRVRSRSPGTPLGGPITKKKKKTLLQNSTSTSAESALRRREPSPPVTIKEEDDKLVIKVEDDEIPQRLQHKIRLLREERDTLKSMLSLVTKRRGQKQERMRLLLEERKLLDELIETCGKMGDDGLQLEFLEQKRINIKEERRSMSV